MKSNGDSTKPVKSAWNTPLKANASGSNVNASPVKNTTNNNPPPDLTRTASAPSAIKETPTPPRPVYNQYYQQQHTPQNPKVPFYPQQYPPYGYAEYQQPYAYQQQSYVYPGYPTYPQPYTSPTNAVPFVKPTPKVVKISNPNTKEEIQLKKPTTPGGASIVTPKKEVKVVIKNPVTGQEVAKPDERPKSPERAASPERAKSPGKSPVPPKPKVASPERAKSPEHIQEKEEVEKPKVVSEKPPMPPTKVPKEEEGELDELYMPEDVRLIDPSEFGKIEYPEGIVAPIAQAEGIKYSLDFMLSFQEVCTLKPRGMPPHSKIYLETKSVPMQRQSSGGRGRGRGKPDRGDRGDRPSMSRQNSGSRGSLPRRKLPQLVKSENAWDAKKLVKSETDLVLKNVKGLLNKLTWDTFEKLSDKLMQLEISNEEILSQMIEFLSTKAVDELHFSAMYAQLCAKLVRDLPKVHSWIQPDPKKINENMFRRILLKRCQEEFQKDQKWSADDEAYQRERKLRSQGDLTLEEKQQLAEEEFERQKLKRKALGNIRFVGELFLQGLISEKIIHSCILSLIKKEDPDEEDVESLCKLMTSVGKRLDHMEGIKRMDAYFEKIDALSTNTAISSRVRFALMDLIDLRKDKWVPRATGPTSAKSTAQVRKEIEDEERKKQASKGSRLPTRQQQSKKSEVDGWTSIARPEAKPKTTAVRSAWGKPSQKKEEEPKKGNIFDALEQPEAEPEQPVVTKTQEEIVVDAIKNYKESLELREVLEDIKDVDEPLMIQKLVSLVFQFLIDTNGRNALRITNLFKALFFSESAVYDSALFIQGAQKFLSGIEEDLSDFPKAFVNISQVLIPLVDESCITFGDLVEISAPLQEFGGMKPQGGAFIKDVLNTVEAEGGDMIKFMVAHQVNIKSFFKPGTDDATVKKWLFRFPHDLPKVVALTDIVTKTYTFAGIAPLAYKWFNTKEDRSLLARKDFQNILTKSVLEHLWETVIFQNGQSEPTQEKFTSLQSKITLLRPVLEIHDVKCILTASEDFCLSKKITDEYLGDILYRLFHDTGLISTKAFLDYKKVCKPDIAKKLTGWFKHLQKTQ